MSIFVEILCKIKRFLKILGIVVISLLLLLTILTIVLNTNAVQNRIVKSLTEQLSEKLNTEVQIKSVNFRLPNRFKINDFHILDLQKDTLLSVKKLDAHLVLWRLLQKKVIVHSVELDNVDANLSVDNKGVNNFDFLLDAFKSDGKKSNFEIQLKRVKVNNSQLSYRKKRKNIQLKNLNLDLSLDYFKKDSIDLTIHKIAFKEKSGFSLTNFKGRLQGLKKVINISNLSVELPHSKLQSKSFVIRYDSLYNLKKMDNRVRFSTEITSSISLSDFSAFLPTLNSVHLKTKIKGKIRGTASNINLSNVKVDYGNSTHLRANIDLNGVQDLEETFVFADIERLETSRSEVQDLVAKLTNEPFGLPKNLNKLGTVKYKGNLTGFFSNLVSYGTIYTNLGSLKTDILLQFTNKLKNLKYSGSLRTTDFQLGRLANDKLFGKTSFVLKTKGEKRGKSVFGGTVEGNVSQFYFKNYLYKNITLDGEYNAKGFDGSLEINDPNIEVDFDGLVDFTETIPQFNFDLAVENVNLKALNITDKYKNMTFSFNSVADLKGNSIDEMNGFISLDKMQIINGDDKFNLRKFKIQTAREEDKTHLKITSNLLNGEVFGRFNYSSLSQTIFSLLEQYIPSLVTAKKRNDDKVLPKNELKLNIEIKRLEQLAKILELPFSTQKTTTIDGTLNETENHLDLQLTTPNLFLKGRKFENVLLALNNKKQELDLLLKTDYLTQGDVLKTKLISTAKNDTIYTNLMWDNRNVEDYSGKFSAVTFFKKNKNDEDSFRQIFTQILPTKCVLADSVWQVEPSQITVVDKSLIKVNKFQVSHKNQHLLVNGEIAKQGRLDVDLQKVDIGFLMKLIDLQAVLFDGQATGFVKAYDVMKNPFFEGKVEVENAMINNTLLGDGKVEMKADKLEPKILLSGIFKQKEKQVALIDGYFNLQNRHLNLLLDANGLNLGFLNKWLDDIFNDIKGEGSGRLHIIKDEKGFGFEGNVYAKNVNLNVGFLNTDYYFSDTIYLKRNLLELKNITFSDKNNHKGVVNGYLKHNGLFLDLDYNIDAQANDMLVLDTKAKDNSIFYGKAYATGKANISGSQREKVTHITVTAKTESKTDFNIIATGNGEATDNTFITFVEKTDSLNIAKKENSKNTLNKNNILVNLRLNITPQAKGKLLINPRTGDMISANGAGNISLEFDRNRNKVELYGGYTINKGKFLFSLQDLIRKEFQIKQGSNISWSGDVLKAMLDVKAFYSLTASLRDLMSEDMLANVGRTSVPVNCVLNLKNELTNPDISFNIDLPSSGQTLKNQVRNLMTTDEMLNRQVVYLLLFNRFYTPQEVNNGDNNTDWAIVNSILTGQVNNWLSKFDNSVSVGVNYRTSGYGQEISQEYETTLMVQPNSRLLVNGSIGYRNDQLAKNKIIGDVDVEYILTKNQKWRIKAYNHTVDRYTLRSAPFIHGVGVMYKESFDTWSGLWRDLFRRKQSKKTNENKVDTVSKQTTDTIQIKTNTKPKTDEK